MASPASRTLISLPVVPRLFEESNSAFLPVVIVAGPTACGKSALALAVAEALDGAIINADSMQVYHDLSILTARPDATDMDRRPHRLYGVLSAAKVCSAARWLALARVAVAKAHAVGQLPVVVGGTGLYIEVLRHGLASVPEIPVAVQAGARALMTIIGPAAFHARLAVRDPTMAARLRPSDTQRLQRAWEVMEATGRSLADWQQRGAVRGEAPPAVVRAERFCTLLLMPPRPMLQAACNGRFRRMVAAGAVAEVAALLARDLPPDRPILKALGVATLADYIRGRLSLEEAITTAQGATRRYAKRQCTWFCHRLTDALIIPYQYSFGHPLTVEILSFVRHFLLI